MLFVGNFVFMYLNVAGSVQRGYFDLAKYALLSPLYWGLMSIAAWKGFIQLFYQPFYWEKTVHGLRPAEAATAPPPAAQSRRAAPPADAPGCRAPSPSAMLAGTAADRPVADRGDRRPAAARPPARPARARARVQAVGARAHCEHVAEEIPPPRWIECSLLFLIAAACTSASATRRSIEQRTSSSSTRSTG